MIQLNFNQPERKGCLGLFSKKKEGPEYRQILYLHEVLEAFTGADPSRLAYALALEPKMVQGLSQRTEIRDHDHFKPEKHLAGTSKPLIIEDIPRAIVTLGQLRVTQYLKNNLGRFVYNKKAVQEFVQTPEWINHKETEGMLTYEEVVNLTGYSREDLCQKALSPEENRWYMPRKRKEKITLIPPPSNKMDFQKPDDTGGDDSSTNINGQLLALLDRYEPDPEVGAAMLNTTILSFVRGVAHNNDPEATNRKGAIEQAVFDNIHLCLFSPEEIKPHITIRRTAAEVREAVLNTSLNLAVIGSLAFLGTVAWPQRDKIINWVQGQIQKVQKEMSEETGK